MPPKVLEYFDACVELAALKVIHTEERISDLQPGVDRGVVPEIQLREAIRANYLAVIELKKIKALREVAMNHPDKITLGG